MSSIILRVLRPFAISSVIFLSVMPSADAIGLADLIHAAEDKAEIVKAADKTIQAVENDIKGRDLLLSPRWDTEFSSTRESKATLLPINRYRSQLVTTSLTKLFSTGTTISTTLANDLNDNSTFGTRNIGSWAFAITQSLWRDGFGRGTTLRHEGEANELRSKTFTATYQKQNFLVSLESAYWDLLLARRQVEIAKTNRDRSQTVAKWTRERVRHSTAEQTDLLQADALLSSRELDLQSLNNTILTTENVIRTMIPGLPEEGWSVNLKELETSRSVETLIAGGNADTSKEPVRLDALSSKYSARQAKAEFQRIEQNLNPRLDAYANYGQSGADPNFGGAWNSTTDPQFASSKIGVQFSIDLDWNLRQAQRQAASANAEALEYQARAQERVSKIGWFDLNRQIADLKKQANAAHTLADLNERKVAAERDRYKLGKTTTFQLVTFEIDASTSQLTLSKILADLRKAEGRARIFTRIQDGV